MPVQAKMTIDRLNEAVLTGGCVKEKPTIRIGIYTGDVIDRVDAKLLGKG